MPKSVNISTLYILLWLVYYSQGVFYETGSFISQGVLGVLLVLSFYCFIKVNEKGTGSNFIKSLNIFLIVMTFYGVFHILLGKTAVITELTPHIEVTRITFLKNIYISLLPIYSFYYYSKKGLLTENTIKFAFIMLLLIAVISYINNYERAILKNKLKDGDEVTNNGAYGFVALLPLLLMWKKRPVLTFLFLILILFFVFAGMKRGAMIIGCGMFIYFIYKYSKMCPPKYKLIVNVLCTLIVIGTIYYAIDFYNNSEYFQKRMDATMEGNSSHRDEFYTSLLDYFIHKTGGMALLIGNGPDYTISVIGNYAHNDWLEIAVNQGILGLIVYFNYFLGLFKDILTSKYCIDKNIRVMLIMVFFSMFMTSLFSMSYAAMRLATSLVLGYALSNLPYRKPIMNT